MDESGAAGTARGNSAGFGVWAEQRPQAWPRWREPRDGGSPGMEVSQALYLSWHRVFVQGHKLGASAVSKLFCGVLRELE